MKGWITKELDKALDYYQALGWCPKTGGYPGDMKALSAVIRKVDQNKIAILDGFMKNNDLREFLIIHSVFNIDARTDGEFIEKYMASRIHVSEDQVNRLFARQIPDEIEKKFAMFDIELIPFDVEIYRVEFGCRKDPETGKYPHDPIRLLDTTMDIKIQDSVMIAAFISQYEDLML